MKHKIHPKNKLHEAIILGVDPGTAETGFGILLCQQKENFQFGLFESNYDGKLTKKETVRRQREAKRRKILHCLESTKLSILASGSIKTKSVSESCYRLNIIFDEVSKLIDLHQPSFLAIESLFFNSNATSASAVGQAIGVVKLAAHKKGLKVTDFAPLKIKMQLLGDGRAEKKAVQEQVKKVLKLAKIPRPTHAADALAAAICHWLDFFNL